MRTVICHFFNEEYLLPWWLKHHRELFDYGIMIDHGSTDQSIEIIRALVPSWKIVRSRLLEFDAFLTDFEVMKYEQDLPGWKVALNVTEFLMTTVSLSEIESAILSDGRHGFCLSGIIMVDEISGRQLEEAVPLPLQCFHGFDENDFVEKSAVPVMLTRSRFYHCAEVGMYQPGRHTSWHQDSKARLYCAMNFYYGFAPWNEQMKRRRLQVAAKVPESDINRGWGTHFLHSSEQLELEFLNKQASAYDLLKHPYAGQAISMMGERLLRSLSITS